MSTTTALAVALIAVSVLDIALVLTVALKNRRIATLQRQLATALGIIGERDDVIRELEAANANLDARNERLHHDVKAMRERLPMLAGELAASVVLDEDVSRPYIKRGQVNVADIRIPDLTDEERVAFVEPWEETR